MAGLKALFNIHHNFLDVRLSPFDRSFLPQEIWQQYTVKKPTDLGNTLL